MEPAAELADPPPPLRTRLFLLLRPLDNPTGTIYGTLIGAAILAAEGSKREGIGEIAIAVLVTLVVYWFAHGYADMLPARAESPSPRGRLRPLSDLGHALREEWPIVAGGLALLAVLLLAGLLGASPELAVDVALWFAVVELLVWGMVAARAARVTGWPMVLYGFGSAALGVAIATLKVLLH